MNSKLPVQTINQWLQAATEQFERTDIPSAQLDAALLLCHMLGVDRTWLIAHAEESLARAALTNPGGVRPGGISVYGEKIVLRRLKREPMAYILGKKEFYGREFTVTKDVLIPRPETEALIELAKKYQFSGNIVDVGSGSGAIGLTLAKELPAVTITLSDFSPAALEVAEKNAKQLRIKPVTFTESDLLGYWREHKTPEQFDVIVANLPYVDKSWERSPETAYEPRLALFADDGGLALINELIEQTPAILKPGGYVLLEADPEQHAAIVEKASQNDLTHLASQDYGILLQRS